MENELRIIAGLEPEQVAERAAAVVLELTYWQQVIADCAAVNDATLACSTAILEASASTLMTLAVSSPETVPLIEATVGQLRDALNAVKTIADTLGSTLELADGRQKALRPVGRALRSAAGLDPDDDDTGRAEL